MEKSYKPHNRRIISSKTDHTVVDQIDIIPVELPLSVPSALIRPQAHPADKGGLKTADKGEVQLPARTSRQIHALG